MCPPSKCESPGMHRTVLWHFSNAPKIQLEKTARLLVVCINSLFQQNESETKEGEVVGKSHLACFNKIVKLAPLLRRCYNCCKFMTLGASAACFQTSQLLFSRLRTKIAKAKCKWHPILLPNLKMRVMFVACEMWIGAALPLMTMHWHRKKRVSLTRCQSPLMCFRSGQTLLKGNEFLSAPFHSRTHLNRTTPAEDLKLVGYHWRWNSPQEPTGRRGRTLVAPQMVTVEEGIFSLSDHFEKRHPLIKDVWDDFLFDAAKLRFSTSVMRDAFGIKNYTETSVRPSWSKICCHSCRRGHRWVTGSSRMSNNVSRCLLLCVQRTFQQPFPCVLRQT